MTRQEKILNMLQEILKLPRKERKSRVWAPLWEETKALIDEDPEAASHRTAEPGHCLRPVSNGFCRFFGQSFLWTRELQKRASRSCQSEIHDTRTNQTRSE